MSFAIGALLMLVWISLFFGWKMGHAFKGRYSLMNDFLERERTANSVRRKEIEDFFTPDLSALPVTDDGDASQEKVLRRAVLTMVRLPQQMTNIDIKMAYGAAQLEKIIQYEENFHSYLEALIEWAESLAAVGRNDDALRILWHTVADLQSEYRKSYTLAADLYAANRDMDGLNALLTKAESHTFRDAGVKRRIIMHIINQRNEADE